MVIIINQLSIVPTNLEGLQMQTQLEYPRIQHCAANSFTNQCRLISHTLNNMVSPDASVRESAQIYLQQCRNYDIGDFIIRLASIITSGQFPFNDAYLSICYLRDTLNTFKNKMGNLLTILDQISQQCPIKLKQIAIQCLIIYLSQSKNAQYRKIYLQDLINGLTQINNANNKKIKSMKVDTKLLIKISNILGSKQMQKKCDINFNRGSQKIIYQIIKDHEFGIGTTQVQQNVWISFILSLCNYTSFKPSIRFIYKNIVSNRLTNKQLIILSSMYDRNHHKYSEYQEIENILKTQLQRLQDKELLRNVSESEECDQVEVYEIIINNVKKAAKDLILMRFDKTQQEYRQQFQMGLVACQHQFLSDSSIIQIIKTILFTCQHNQQYQQLACDALQQIVHPLGNRTANHDSIFKVLLAQLTTCQNAEWHLYMILSIMYPQINNYFNTDGYISWAAQQFFTPNTPNTLAINQHSNVLKLFTTCKLINKFMASSFLCLLNNQNKEPNCSIKKFMNAILNSDPQVPKAIKAYAFSILCKYHQNTIKNNKFNESENKKEILEQVYCALPQILAIGYAILVSQANADIELSQMQTDPQTDSIVVDSLKELSRVYKQHMYGHFLNFLNASLVNAYQSTNVHIYGYFLQMLHSCFQAPYTDTRLLAVLTACYQSNNQSLQSQATQLILTITFKTNILVRQTFMTSTFSKSVMTQLLKTGVLAYIQRSLIEQQDDILFTKILAEFVIYEHVHQSIQNMLNRVCAVLPDWLAIQYNFDKIWEILIIVYKTTNSFPFNKLISKKIQDIYQGNLSALLDSMDLKDEEQITQRQQKLNLSQHKGIIYWSSLPDVRRVIQEGSIVLQFVDNALEN